MFKKLTPILILLLFSIGTYFMIQGMDDAVKAAKGEHPLVHKK
jgi:hypothetical protein